MTELSDYLGTCAVVPSSVDAALAWARIRAERNAASLPNEEVGMWIAASAIVLYGPLATNNVAHFSKTPGLRLITLGPPL